MGTSSDHPGGTGTAWSKARTGAGDWASSGGGAGPGLARVIADAAIALAGYTGTSAANAAAPGLARIGGLAAAPDGTGGGESLNEALTRIGLDDLVGRNLDDIRSALVNYIAQDPQDRDADIVLSAADDAVEEALEGLDPDDLDTFVFDQPTVERMMQRYLAEWLTRLVTRELGTVITDQNPTEANQRSAEIREYVTERLANVIDQRTIDGVDWNGPEGTAQARAIIDGAREVFIE